MSTAYYLACRKCRECIHIARDGLGFTFYSEEPDCMRKLGEFLGGHKLGREHDITLLSEHDLDDGDPYEERKWTPKRDSTPGAAGGGIKEEK